MIPVTVLRILSAIVLMCCVAIIVGQARQGKLRGRHLLLQIIGLGLWAVGLALSFVL